jgi:predicted MPP superfamily phosphohydrolase
MGGLMDLSLLLVGAVTFGVMAAALLYYGTQVELFNFEIVPLEVTIPRLAPEFDGYRIAQISDLHHDGLYIDDGNFARAVDMINGQDVNAVLITGDFVSREIDESNGPLLERGLSNLHARDGVFAAMGNHDYKADINQLRGILDTAGIIEMRNDVYTIERDGATLSIAGVDDVVQEKNSLDVVIEKLPEDTSATILMVHEPDYADTTAATGRFDLQLSGHSHAGQICIPIRGPLFRPELGKKYPVGLYHINDMLLYTNRGLGVVKLPIRINCRPEITVITLRSGKNP